MIRRQSIVNGCKRNSLVEKRLNGRSFLAFVSSQSASAVNVNQKRTRTIAILPLDSYVVELRHRVEGGRITGAYRTPGSKEWTVAGTCEVSVKPGEPGPRVSLQAYQGPASVERWARLRRFTVRRGPFTD